MELPPRIGNIVPRGITHDSQITFWLESFNDGEEIPGPVKFDAGENFRVRLTISLQVQVRSPTTLGQLTANAEDDYPFHIRKQLKKITRAHWIRVTLSSEPMADIKYVELAGIPYEDWSEAQENIPVVPREDVTLIFVAHINGGTFTKLDQVREFDQILTQPRGVFYRAIPLDVLEELGQRETWIHRLLPPNINKQLNPGYHHSLDNLNTWKQIYQVVRTDPNIPFQLEQYKYDAAMLYPVLLEFYLPELIEIMLDYLAVI